MHAETRQVDVDFTRHFVEWATENERGPLAIISCGTGGVGPLAIKDHLQRYVSLQMVLLKLLRSAV